MLAGIIPRFNESQDYSRRYDIHLNYAYSARLSSLAGRLGASEHRRCYQDQTEHNRLNSQNEL